MKRRWIVLLLLFMMIGAAGYGFTREEAQKVQKTSSLKIQAVYLECESEEANPLLEDAVLEVNRAVEEHFAKMQGRDRLCEKLIIICMCIQRKEKMRIHM